MSKQNFMEKLLDGVDVAWKPLGELGEFIRGNGLQKKDLIGSGFPAIHYGQIYTRYSLFADKTFTYVEKDFATKLRKAQKNDLLLATTSENDEDVVKPLAWLGGDVAISGDMMFFRHKQNVKYLAYFFLTEAFQEQKRKYITGAKVRRVSRDSLAKIEVPIPCPNLPEKSLAIQGEIVRILDTFTELEARRRQYKYYRDALLTFDDASVASASKQASKQASVRWTTMGEVCLIKSGQAVSKKMISDNYGDYPVINSGREPLGFIAEWNTEDDPIGITTRGAGVGSITWQSGRYFRGNLNYSVTYKG